MQACQVFLCYRRIDTLAEAERIQLAIDTHFGAGAAFRDESSVESGNEWPDVLESALESARVVLILIGKRWWDQNEQGNRPIDREEDWVRREIKRSLESKNGRVIPVLLNGQKASSVLDENCNWPAGCEHMKKLQAESLDFDGDWSKAQADLLQRLESAGIEDRRNAGPGTTERPPSLDGDSTEKTYRRALHAENCSIQPVGFPSDFRVSIEVDDLWVPLRASVQATSRELEDSELEQLKIARDHWKEVSLGRTETDPLSKGLPSAFDLASERGRRAIVLSGQPGSGKTTLLKRITVGVLTQGAGVLSTATRDTLGQAALLPVLVPLRRLSSDDIRAGLTHAVATTLPKTGDRETPLDSAFARWLVQERGSLIVLLDGLDEIDPSLRETVLSWIRPGGDESASPSWFLLTSRPTGLTPELLAELDEQALSLTIRPFDDPQIRRFVTNWYGIIERAVGPVGADQRAHERTEDLLCGLQEPDVRASRVYELASNPLLLTIICLVQRDGGGTLPRERARLYQAAVDVLLERWRRGKHLPVRVSTDNGVRLLGPVADFLHREDQRTSATAEELAGALDPLLPLIDWQSSAEQFLKTIEHDSGILAGLGDGRFGFLHLGLQEYLAAVFLQQRCASLGTEDPSKLQSLLDTLVERTGDGWWQEVLLLIFALPTEPRLYGPVVQRLIWRPMSGAELQFLDLALSESRLPPAELARPFKRFVEALGSREQSVNEEQASMVADRLLRVAPRAAAELAPRLLPHVSSSTARMLRDRAERFGVALPENRAESPTETPTTTLATQRRNSPPNPTERLRYEEHRGLEFVLIPAGSFQMGGTALPDERPLHRVEIRDPFWIATTPVTNAQYRRFVSETGHESPASWSDRNLSGDDQPTVTIDFEAARRFCQWLGPNYALPSEAMWEYACRAGSQYDYSFGNDPRPLGEHAWFSENSGRRIQPVAAKPPNPFGLYDMHGNIWEWCADEWHKNYEGAPNDGSVWELPEKPQGSTARVVRGGSFLSFARYCRSACRSGRLPDLRLHALGFRPARFVTE